MEDLLKRRPKFSKKDSDVLNAIVNRSRKRKPSNQNQVQTRKNRNVVQALLSEKSKASTSREEAEWLDDLDRLLKDQYHDAQTYVPSKPPLAPKKFIISDKVLAEMSKKALTEVSETLEEEGVKPKPVAKPKFVAQLNALLEEEAPSRPSQGLVAVVRAASPPKPSGRLPPLYTKSKTGKVQQWQVHVVKNKDDTATIITQWGYVDGEKMTSNKQIKEGKNKGRVNETTPYEQAVLEATSAWEKKKTAEGYAEKITDAAIPGVASDSIKEGPLMPMLAHNYRKRGGKIQFPCYVQAKLDGVRSIFRNGVFTSRTAKPLGIMDHIVKELKPAIDAGLVLDGELYSTTLTFQEIVGLVKKKKLTAKDHENIKHINLWVYDLVNSQPFEQRLALLVDFFTKHKFSHVHLLPTEECESKEKIKGFHDKYVKAGYEGLILRNKKGLYRVATRSDNLQKYKEFEDDEFKIVGFTEGEGNEKGAVIWICETAEKKQFRVRPMGSVEERRELFKKGKTYVGKKLTVKYQEMTDDGIPRFGIGVAIRDYE